jgi:hypothetical protein
MEKVDEITQIGIEALCILKRLQSDDADTVKTAMKDHLKLVDLFYRENYDIIASPQYETAKKDYEYFLRLVCLALEYHGKEK